MLNNFDPFSGNFNPFGGKSMMTVSCYYDKENKSNVLESDLPGLNSNTDLSIKLEGRKIIISGERKCESERLYFFSQPWCGKFYNAVSLSKDISSQDIKTSYKNGVVKITIINQDDIIVSGIQSKLNDNQGNSTQHSYSTRFNISSDK